ncbi:hypothetical protein JCM30760_10390 [Thiomicrorhabdus hydrogeniphila]
MNEVFEKSFRGLTREFYLRHFLIGFLVGFAFIFVNTKGFAKFEFFIILYGLISTALYPYSRYGLESGMNKLFGSDGSDSTVLLDAGFVIAEKIIAVLMSWFLALIIAPFALIQIYKLNNTPRQDV